MISLINMEIHVMRALRYHRYNGDLAIEELPDPAPGTDEVLVRIAAAALNPLDLKLHSGRMQWYFELQLPYAMGTDLAGIVASVGAGVVDFRPGDRVVCRRPPLLGGAVAELALLPQGDCAALPPAMSMLEGAAIPTAAGTARASVIEVAKLKAGQSILIHAGAGGVGSFAVQFAKLAGAHVIATASGDGVELVRSLGADEVIDYRAHDFVRAVSDVDVVLDTIGLATQERSFDVLKPGGHLVSLVSAPDSDKARTKGVAASRVYYQLRPGQLRALVDEVAAKQVKVLIDSTVPFEQFPKALDRLGSGRARGKVVLELAATSRR
jgi:NADPH:quinone reductase-like Zn-dependent oxidoreductase